MPVISNLVYTVTDTTIVATWTTDVAADSNLSAGGKAAIDNGVAANSTSHQAIVVGLAPSTLYSCTVTSGGTSSSPQNVTTNVAPVRKLVVAATLGSIQTVANAPQGDTYRTFVSSDNNTYITQDDGYGFVAGSPNSGYNTQLGVLTDENLFAGTLKSLSAYGAFNTLTGTDGPGSAAMTNKSTGLFGLNGNLHMFVYRQFPPTYSTWRYCNWIKSTDHGATWNNFTATSTFLANGNPVTPNSPSEPIQFYASTIGLVSPVLYAADDGTLGYNTAGNQIDGANAYVYCVFWKDATPAYLLRIPRIQFDAQATTAFQYWIGPTSPTAANFVDDTQWSSSPTSATNIATNVTPLGVWQVAFVPKINSYLLTTIATGSPGTIFTFYSAPTPAGPWTLFFAQNNTVTGSQWGLPMPMHRDLIQNTATNNIPIRILFEGEASGSNYKPNWATLTLETSLANTFIQGTGTTNAIVSSATPGLAYGSNVTSGNLLIFAWRRATGGTVNNVTDTIGNTWTVVYDTVDGGSAINGGWAWAVSKASGANTVTLNLSVSNAATVLAVGEWNGPNAVRATIAAALSTSSTTPTSSAITPTSGDLLIGLYAGSTGVASAVAGTGYTLRAQGEGSAGTVTYVAVEDNLSAAGGSTTASFTVSGGANGQLTGIGAFYTAATGGSGSWTQGHRSFINKRIQ